MKRIALVISLLPGSALAHGTHGPAPEPALHWAAHALPAVAIVALVAAAVVAWRARQ